MRKKYPDEFKAAMLGLAILVGPKRACYMCGIPEQTLLRWRFNRRPVNMVLADRLRETLKHALRENGWEMYCEQMRQAPMQEKRSAAVAESGETIGGEWPDP